MSVPSSHPVPRYPIFIDGRKVYTKAQEEVILAEKAEKGKPSAADLDAVAAEAEVKEVTNKFASE